jgi:hypothetical protein
MISDEKWMKIAIDEAHLAMMKMKYLLAQFLFKTIN